MAQRMRQRNERPNDSSNTDRAALSRWARLCCGVALVKFGHVCQDDVSFILRLRHRGRLRPLLLDLGLRLGALLLPRLERLEVLEGQQVDEDGFARFP